MLKKSDSSLTQDESRVITDWLSAHADAGNWIRSPRLCGPASLGHNPRVVGNPNLEQAEWHVPEAPSRLATKLLYTRYPLCFSLP